MTRPAAQSSRPFDLWGYDRFLVFHRGEEEQKGPIRRNRRGNRYRRPAGKGSDHARIGPEGGEATPPPATSGGPSDPKLTINPTLQPPSSFDFPAVTPRRRYRASGLRWLIAGGSVLLVIAAIAIPVISVSNTIHSVSPLFNSGASNAPAPSSQSAAPRAPSPVRPAAYLTVPGLRAGLASIAHQAPGARVALVRIAENSLSATVKLPNGTIKELIYAPTGRITVSVPTLGERAIPISQIRPGAVARLIAGMRTRFHVPASRIDYIVLSTPPGVPSQWIVFSKAAGHPGYTATLNGTKLARLPG